MCFITKRMANVPATEKIMMEISHIDSLLSNKLADTQLMKSLIG
jgi:hypothetical protein